MPITLLFRPAPTTLDRTDASMCMTDMMVLAFDTVLRSHTDVELTPDGLRVIYNALSFRIYPIQAMALRLLKASTVVAVLRGMVFFMNQEGFTYKSVGIYHDQAGPIGVAKFER
ncbi:hypothetical protein N7G274_004760 [Stereocaulon virgatum]|uniref:Uncharacterized protein n=1 Tax=Stereocaulon virgatum TaxID=373712 RepID=A0ABR4ACP4_9LECA